MKSFLLSSILLCIWISSSYAQNCLNYSNCPSCDDPIIDYSDDLIAMLDQGGVGYNQFYNSANAAIELMRNYSGVITDDDWLLHMTIDYLCCYNVITYGEIIDTISNFYWEPLQLRFSKAICNYDNDILGTNSIVVLLDDESQAAAQAFIKKYRKCN